MADVIRPSGFVPVRLPIDLGRVLAFVRRELDPAFRELAAWQANNGMSNPTYLLYDPARPSKTNMYILRKKPPGKLLKSAHDIEREYRVMRALQDGGVAVPVPRIYHYCRDLSVVGTEFYVMEYVEGRVFEDDTLPGFSASQRAALYADMVRVLAALHAADFRALGLERHGKVRRVRPPPPPPPPPPLQQRGESCVPARERSPTAPSPFLAARPARSWPPLACGRL